MMDFSSGWGTSTSGEREDSWAGGRRTPGWRGMGALRGSPPPPQDAVPSQTGAPAHTFGVQQARHPQVPLGHGESLVQVLQVALAIHPVHVDQHGPVGSGNGSVRVPPGTTQQLARGSVPAAALPPRLADSRARGRRQRPPPVLPHGVGFQQVWAPVVWRNPRDSGSTPAGAACTARASAEPPKHPARPRHTPARPCTQPKGTGSQGHPNGPKHGPQSRQTPRSHCGAGGNPGPPSPAGGPSPVPTAP